MHSGCQLHARSCAWLCGNTPEQREHSWGLQGRLGKQSEVINTFHECICLCIWQPGVSVPVCHAESRTALYWNSSHLLEFWCLSLSFEPSLKVVKSSSSPDLPHHTSKVHFKEVSKARVDLEVKYKLIFFHHKPHNLSDFSEDLGYLFIYLFDLLSWEFLKLMDFLLHW